MKVILVSKCSLGIEQYVEFKMSVLISPSMSLISSRWVTNVNIKDWRKMHFAKTIISCMTKIWGDGNQEM